MTVLFTRLRFFNALALVLILSVIVSHATYAVESNIVVTDNVKTKLISEHSQLEAGQTVSILLQIDIRDGWHTYWRNPGDSGQATSIKWTLPEGVTASDIEWPYPERQYVGPVANYGYHGVALHRVQLTVADNWPVNKPIQIVADAKWLVCEEECIPEKGRFEMQLPVADTAQLAKEYVSEFERFKKIVPSPLAVQSGYQYANNGELRFEFSPISELTTASNIEYFPHEWGVIQAPAKQTVVIDKAFVSISSLKGDLTFTKPLQGVLVVTDSDGDHNAYQIKSQPGALMIDGSSVVISNAGQTSSISLLGALLFALVGGLILNLMPCVFPVLSMKALSLVSHADESPETIKRHGLVYTFGILLSFAVLGVALLLLKSAGHQIGWGFQLQSPVFVGVIVVVLFVLGLSLSGFVEIGTSLMGVGSGLAQHSGYKGSFFTGVLAVLVATPCTAPFMGPAVGFALTQSPVITLAVLLALGLGLALPYLLLCYFPVLSAHLPKPGLWMKKLQQFLAFPMYATAVWLVWVFGLQAGINRVFALLIICVLVALAIWFWQSAKTSNKSWGAILRSLSVIVLVLVIVLMFNIAKVPTADQSAAEGITSAAHYEAFSIERLNELQSKNSPVFVNMTAAWCITCLANEKVALSTSELKTYFEDNGITYLKGDWTNQDPVITSYLESFGRSSVPLYVYYPNQGEPIVLPQILSVAGVIDSMKSAELNN